MGRIATAGISSAADASLMMSLFKPAPWVRVLFMLGPGRPNYQLRRRPHASRGGQPGPDFAHIPGEKKDRVARRAISAPGSEWRVSPYFAAVLVGTTGLENSPASNLGFISTFSIIVFSGGTGVSGPKAVLATGSTLVSRTNGISRPFTLR